MLKLIADNLVIAKCGAVAFGGRYVSAEIYHVGSLASHLVGNGGLLVVRHVG